ncbi:MAG: 50S ribosomal protein L18 [Candidatus Omnitrophota bacterium]|nr:50S ribosomal protein L18 [Candidatus Omnitrophota bacterium]
MLKKELIRLKRHKTIRLKIYGTALRPRLVVRRSLKNLSAALINDAQNKTLVSLSTNDKEIKQKVPSGGNVNAAQFLGEMFVLRAKEKNITKILFDRAGYLYHGRIKAFADAVRKGGVEF